MAEKIILRNDTAQNLEKINPVLNEGEPCIDIDSNTLKIGDGVNSWKNLQGISGGSQDKILAYNTRVNESDIYSEMLLTENGNSIGGCNWLIPFHTDVEMNIGDTICVEVETQEESNISMDRILTILPVKYKIKYKVTETGKMSIRDSLGLEDIISEENDIEFVARTLNIVGLNENINISYYNSSSNTGGLDAINCTEYGTIAFMGSVLLISNFNQTIDLLNNLKQTNTNLAQQLEEYITMFETLFVGDGLLIQLCDSSYDNSSSDIGETISKWWNYDSISSKTQIRKVNTYKNTGDPSISISTISNRGDISEKPLYVNKVWLERC